MVDDPRYKLSAADPNVHRWNRGAPEQIDVAAQLSGASANSSELDVHKQCCRALQRYRVNASREMQRTAVDYSIENARANLVGVRVESDGSLRINNRHDGVIEIHVHVEGAKVQVCSVHSQLHLKVASNFLIIQRLAVHIAKIDVAVVGWIQVGVEASALGHSALARIGRHRCNNNSFIVVVVEQKYRARSGSNRHGAWCACSKRHQPRHHRCTRRRIKERFELATVAECGRSLQLSS